MLSLFLTVLYLDIAQKEVFYKFFSFVFCPFERGLCCVRLSQFVLLYCSVVKKTSRHYSKGGAETF
jgi:hypothetical protein